MKSYFKLTMFVLFITTLIPTIAITFSDVETYNSNLKVDSCCGWVPSNALLRPYTNLKTDWTEPKWQLNAIKSEKWLVTDGFVNGKHHFWKILERTDLEGNNLEKINPQFIFILGFIAFISGFICYYAFFFISDMVLYYNAYKSDKFFGWIDPEKQKHPFLFPLIKWTKPKWVLNSVESELWLSSDGIINGKTVFWTVWESKPNPDYIEKQYS